MVPKRYSDTAALLRRMGLDAQDDGDDVTVGRFRIVAHEPETFAINGETFQDLHALVEHINAKGDSSCLLELLADRRLAANRVALLAYLSAHFGDDIDELVGVGKSCLARSRKNGAGTECGELIVAWLATLPRRE